MIIGGVFVVVCLLSYLGPRTLEAFLDPPEPEAVPVDIKKYSKTGDYTLDRSANVLYKEKAKDNTQLKRIRDMFLTPNVVEGMTSCGKFGCCEKLNLAKIDKKGSNCNGFCDYNDTSDTTPTSGSTPKIKCPGTNYYVTSIASCPATGTNPYASATGAATGPATGAAIGPATGAAIGPATGAAIGPVATVPAMGMPYETASADAESQPGNTDTIFIAPPTKNFGQREIDRLKPYKRRKTGGSGGKCGVCPEPQPCPACARCPEPSFDCKKVPNYASTNSEYLPMPILTDFSTFGM